MSESNFLTVGGQTSFDMPLTFRAQSAVINNLSNQWVELLDANDTFVPPYIVNMIVTVGGGTRFRASFAAPTGIPQAATIAGQRVTVEVFETALQPNAGQLFPVRAPSTEWRNPKGLVFASSSIAVGPQGSAVILFSYTVPVGRRARIDTAQLISELSASDGSGASTDVVCGLQFFPLGAPGSGTNIGLADIFTGTALGARADWALGAGKELQATDLIRGYQQNPRGAGVTQAFTAVMVVTEGDS